MFLIVYAADVSDAALTSTVTISETSGSAQTNSSSAFPLSTQAFIDSSVLATATLNAIVCEVGPTCPIANEVASMPSPVQTRIEGAHQDDGGVFTDETTDANNDTANDVTLLPVVVAVNDAFYFLADHQFRVVWLNIGTAGTTATTTFAWEYFDGTSYVAVSGLDDATSGFATAGTNAVTFDIADDLSEDTINGTTGFSVRARVSAGTGALATQPLATQIWYEPGIWRVFNDALRANQAQDYTLFIGGPTDMATSHAMFLGLGGATTTDDAALEAGIDSQVVTINAFIDTDSTGVERQIWSKGPGNRVSHSSSTSGTLIFDMDRSGGTDCEFEATGISSGDHNLSFGFITVLAICLFQIDGIVAYLDTGHGTTSVDNVSDWVWGAGDSVKYINSIDVTLGASSVLHYELTASTTAIALQDTAGAAQNAVPSWAPFPTSSTSSLAAFTAANAPLLLTQPSGSAVGIVAPTAAFASSSAAVVGLPGGVFISGVATDANLPAEFYWLIIAAFLSLAAFVGVQLTMKNLWWSVIAGGVVLTAFSAPTVGILAVWAIMFYGIMSGLVLIVGDRFQATAG